MIVRNPDLSQRPYNLTVERLMPLSKEKLFLAWTKQFDKWFAAPGSVIMQGEVNTVFFFETEFKHEDSSTVERHPHYGRFLQLEPNRLIQLTWLTGPRGTRGAETIVTVELIPQGNGTLVKLRHQGFPDQASLDQHQQAWPFVLEMLETKISALE